MEFLHKRNIDVMTGYKPENIINDIEEEERFGSYELGDDGEERACKGHFKKLYNAFQEDKDVIIWLMDISKIYGYTKVERVEETNNRGLNFFFSKEEGNLVIFDKPIDIKEAGVRPPLMFSIKELKTDEINNLAVLKKED